MPDHEEMSEEASDAWDEQIERDSLAGRLDDFFAKALADHEAGKSRPIEDLWADLDSRDLLIESPSPPRGEGAEGG
jgi:hypothetical protein